jgi:hypothetical protein
VGKHRTTIGDVNRNLIYNIIAEHYPQGIYQHEIVGKTGLSRQSVYTHLNELMEEQKIYGSKNLYNIVIQEGELLHFSRVIGQAGLALTGIPKYLAYFWDEDGIRHENPDIDFYKKIAKANSISSFCKPRFSKDEVIEKQLFDFASKIGSFLVYIFIEVMRPYEINKIKENDVYSKNRIGRDFLRHVATIECIFRRFQELLLDSGYIHRKSDSKYSFYELDREEFDKLSKAFAKVYPMIYQGLEEYWLDKINYFIEMSEKNIPCIHEWEYFHIYKLGKYYKCHKCLQLASSSDVRKDRK